MVYNILQGQMEKLDELLPGIENYLRNVLYEEKLSEKAEISRQYYIERLDILQLPPTVPPRPTDDVEPLPSPIKKEVKSPSPNRHQVVTVEEDDFAAYQREIARSQLSPGSISGLLDSDSEDEKGVKVYDDIDQDQDQGDSHGNNQRKSSMGGEDSNLYEIPVLKRLPCQEEVVNDYEESVSENKPNDPEVAETSIQEEAQESKPPPLPPRRDRATSDAHSRSSIGSALDEKVPDRPPDLPIRPHLAPKAAIYNMAEKCDTKSEKSNDTIDEDLDDLDGGTSYESYDEETQQDTEMMNKLNIKLPKPLKKTKKHSKHSKTRSSKEWDVALPFNCLEEVTLSGELQYKGKLSWTRKLVALTEGKMLCYKPEKADNKPALVINLMGYDASYTERDSRKGFDIRLMHPALEMHHFSVDFKDWANMWCEYVGAMAQGKPPPGQYHHLARSSTFGGLDSSRVYGSKTNLGHSVSNISTCSSADNLDFDSSSLKKKKRKNSRKVNRMGSIAFRATQFFESIGKKSGKRMPVPNMPTSVSLGDVKERLNSSTSSHGFSPLTTPTSQPETPVFLSSEIPKAFDDKRMSLKAGIKHQGHLYIFSSFNRRRWGRRWCVIRNGMFECYRTESSTICELEIWLRNCFLRRAVDETKSQLGLMLVEKNVEKITIEPVTAEDMTGWLQILMNETMTQEIPSGLEEFWVEDPYNDIKSEDLNSPMSDVFGYSIVDEETPKQQESYHHYDLEDTDDLEDSNVTMRSTRDCDKSQSFTSPDVSDTESHVVGSVTGELYSQVQRKSSTLSSQDIERAQQEILNSDIKLTDTRSEDCDSKGNSYPESPGSFGASFDHSSESAEGSMFAEIITKINRHFSRENDRENSELSDQDSEKNTDTAYNSAVCSENSSLERKNKSGQASLSHSQNNLDNISQNDLENSQNDLDTLSQVTDILVSPMEDSQGILDSKNIIQIEVTNPDDDSFNMRSEDQSDDGVALMDQSDLSRTADFISEEQMCELHEVTKLSSRDQCDSAIYEGECLIEEDSSTIIHKIEQLRTHLVELKEKRISIRDLKNKTESSRGKEELEAEYSQLDCECKTVSEQILLLEQQVQ